MTSDITQTKCNIQWIILYTQCTHVKIQYMSLYSIRVMKLQRCGHYKWTLQHHGVTAWRLTQPEAINVKMSLIEPNMTLWPPNNPDLNPVDYMMFGECFGRWFTTAGVSSKSVQELRKAISRCVATTVTSVPWLKY